MALLWKEVENHRTTHWVVSVHNTHLHSKLKTLLNDPSCMHTHPSPSHTTASRGAVATAEGQCASSVVHIISAFPRSWLEWCSSTGGERGITTTIFKWLWAIYLKAVAPFNWALEETGSINASCWVDTLSENSLILFSEMAVIKVITAVSFQRSTTTPMSK